MGQVLNQSWAVKAKIARLRAERDAKRTIALPADLAKAATDPVVAETIATQQRLFEARWRALDGQVAVLEKRIDHHKEALSADEAALAATDRQQALTEKELANVEKLFKQGYERLPRVLALQRSVAELQARVSELRGNIGKSRQAILGTELEITAARDARLADIGKELQEAVTLEADLADKLRAVSDVKNRRAIVAPQDGVVVDLKVHTLGGVIAPGQPIMDLVPVEDRLVVEARVRPADIESVRIGLPAKVWLTAYKSSIVPPVDGKVVNVSADKLVDPRTGEPYFASRVAVDAASMAQLEGVTLQPGMPADVMLVTGERRAINYFLEPLTDRMRRAFRER
jgi:HlyD family type I secretion membrane fusion protein